MSVELSLAGERLAVLPERALFWPDRRTLVVADLHLGKAAAFRSEGVPVPAGTTRESLARLDRALDATGARRLICLGDFLHSRAGRTPATLGALEAWRERHPDLEVVVVRGNHDRHAGDPPSSLAIGMVTEPCSEGPFLLCHEPVAHAAGYVLAGHVHPAVRLLGRGRERLRLPCFAFGAHVGLLPAFGAFTGTAVITPKPGDRIFVVSDDRVLPMPVMPARA